MFNELRQLPVLKIVSFLFKLFCILVNNAYFRSPDDIFKEFFGDKDPFRDFLEPFFASGFASKQGRCRSLSPYRQVLKKSSCMLKISEKKMC